MSLAKENIVTALKRIQQAGFALPKKTGRESDSEQLTNISVLWHDLFRYVDPKIFKDATEYILLNCEYFPKPNDWSKAIDICTPEREAKSYTSQAFKGKYTPSPLAKKVFSMMAAGQTKALLDSLPIDSGFGDKVRTIFADATEDFIADNYNRLCEVLESKERCSSCSGLDSCAAEGYTTEGVIDKTKGYLNTRISACVYRLRKIDEYNKRQKGRKGD